jgi:hypothetical protein
LSDQRDLGLHVAPPQTAARSWLPNGGLFVNVCPPVDDGVVNLGTCTDVRVIKQNCMANNGSF